MSNEIRLLFDSGVAVLHDNAFVSIVPVFLLKKKESWFFIECICIYIIKISKIKNISILFQDTTE